MKIDNGFLEYKSEAVYLGAIISDSGSTRNDIDMYVDKKRSNITIKYNNFIRKNTLAPLSVKLQILDTCVSSALIYGCESWGLSNIARIETTYRLGLKRALSIRETFNTEIVNIETGRCPLSVRITQQQLSFWIALKKYLADNLEHPLRHLIQQCEDLNIGYIKYYKNLSDKFTTPSDCRQSLSAIHVENTRSKIRRLSDDDPDSRSGVYLRVNPELTTPTYDSSLLEFDRISVSRYRSGSHMLKVEAGRLCCPKILRENRICSCQTGVQSLHHVLFSCPLLHGLHNEFNFTTIEDAFQRNDIHNFFNKMEKVLKL